MSSIETINAQIAEHKKKIAELKNQRKILLKKCPADSCYVFYHLTHTGVTNYIVQRPRMRKRPVGAT